VKLALAPVKTLFACAYAAGDLRVNPASGWRARYEQTTVEQSDDDDDQQIKALTEEQLVALLEEIPDEWRLFYTFLAQTGLRISEAIELRWRDFHFGAVNSFKVSRRIYRGRVAPPKSKYGRRTIRLTPTMAQPLWVLRGDPDELVFTGSQGRRIDQSNLMARVLKPAACRAGLGEWVKTAKGSRAESWVGHHTFRHTNATLLFVNGWSAKAVQVWLGHHSPAFTLATYVHLLPDDLPELPAAFAGWGNEGATQPTETDLNAPVALSLETAPSLALARAV
jgi:integrase